MQVKDNLKVIKQQIQEACQKANRDPDDIKIIGVTKYVSVERAAEALEAGVVHLGENRDEGMLAKWEILKDKPVWHFIGSLQTRKVKNIIDKVSYIHSLDRLSLAEEIHKRAESPINCLVQVNVSGEESKQGLEPDNLIEFIKALQPYTNIKVVGLMTMAPFTEDEELLRKCFRKLNELRTSVQQLGVDFAPCKELSMGMSNDFKIAVEEGATIIRIGTALVGE